MDTKGNSDASRSKASKQRGKPRVPVLIITHADGWIESYAERHIDVHVAVMPLMKTAEGQVAAERELEENLPYRYKSLYWPSNRRAADMVRTVRPSDIERRDWNLALLRSIEQAGAILRGEDTEDRRIWTL